MNKEIQHGIRISQILARLNWMDNNLSGCDWCCGGGDEESASLNEEFQKLTGMKTWEYRKEVREFEGSWISKRDFIESNPNCDLLGLTNEVFYDIIKYTTNHLRHKGLLIQGSGTNNPKVKVVL